jgi:hypothetical protein
MLYSRNLTFDIHASSTERECRHIPGALYGSLIDILGRFPVSFSMTANLASFRLSSMATSSESILSDEIRDTTIECVDM